MSQLMTAPQSPQRPLQGNEGYENECGDSDEGNGTVNVTHDVRPRVPARASTSNPFHSPVIKHSKVEPADQIRTEPLGGAHGGHRLSQRTDVRSERHDSA